MTINENPAPLTCDEHGIPDDAPCTMEEAVINLVQEYFGLGDRKVSPKVTLPIKHSKMLPVAQVKESPDNSVLSACDRVFSKKAAVIKVYSRKQFLAIQLKTWLKILGSKFLIFELGSLQQPLVAHRIEFLEEYKLWLAEFTVSYEMTRFRS